MMAAHMMPTRNTMHVYQSRKAAAGTGNPRRALYSAKHTSYQGTAAVYSRPSAPGNIHANVAQTQMQHASHKPQQHQISSASKKKTTLRTGELNSANNTMAKMSTAQHQQFYGSRQTAAVNTRINH